MVAFLLALAEGRNIFTIASYRNASTAETLIGAATALAVLFTMFSALAVALPRRLAKGRSLVWRACPAQGARLLAARHQGDTAFLFDEYAGNAQNLALIAMSKFRLVNMAFRGLMVWLACYVLLLAVNRAPRLGAASEEGTVLKSGVQQASAGGVRVGNPVSGPPASANSGGRCRALVLVNGAAGTGLPVNRRAGTGDF